MKKLLLYILLFTAAITYAQEDRRIAQLRNNIEIITAETPGLAEKVNIKIKQAPLSDFLIAVSEVHKVNISVSPSLRQINIVNNFTDVTVADLLLFLCKEYNLTIEFTGNILAVKPYEAPKEIPKEKVIDVGYDAANDLISLNLKDDKLYDVFKRIMDVTGKNLVFAPGMENTPLTSYLPNAPFDAAMSKMAYANNLYYTKSRDNFYVFEKLDSPSGATAGGSNSGNRPVRQRRSNFFFNIIDKDKQILEVDFENTPIASIIYDIGNELGIDMFIASPLENAGSATVKAKSIHFDELLTKIFESAGQQKGTPGQYGDNNQLSQQSSQGAGSGEFSFLKDGKIYYFGTKGQLTVRNVKSIPMMHRSIELLGDPVIAERSVGRTVSPNINYNGGFNNPGMQLQQQQVQNSNNNQSQPAESILTIVPDEVKKDLDIKIDRELNSFIVNGPAENIQRFESFIKYIDKPVPVVLIEVMLLEISRSAIIETGISAGIGDKPVTTKGTVFPNADITLGAETINKIINRFDGFGSLNIGNVVPDFYVSLKAMESNGDLKIRSSPRLSTLNGHKAQLSIGETTYYVVTNQNFYGSQIPQASEIKNYQPIDAELSVSIKPLVSGDGQITLDIKVIQSSFNGERIDEDAPPGINSREFTSTIRVRDQDLIVLGGLEEKVKNDSGSGVPLLARIPIIKWLFSSRKREDSRKKLTVLIKPSVIY
ncbi:general secretion pathway protein GspD [Flavobacterium sp. D11R37]|uniref:type II secretion system protein GspD n=1 Tax=Flavobacterium coralii TaxID=2838017 RepID=UPI001CA7A7BC|nr:general secretion pathway protein GspD [Flavobacterium coralii]MBY8962540.1 general secretion pathway protein GspD [Flavobacterium coralii]